MNYKLESPYNRKQEGQINFVLLGFRLRVLCGIFFRSFSPSLTSNEIQFPLTKYRRKSR